MAISDVLIIGAGPAGAMTAYSLAKAGLRVRILEKKVFPRHKTCGGGLTHRAFRELPFHIDPLIHQTVTCGAVGINGQSYDTVKSDRPIAYLIDRPTFDDFLLKKALDQGALVHFEQRCLSIDQGKDRVTVTTDDRAYQCRFLLRCEASAHPSANMVCFIN